MVDPYYIWLSTNSIYALIFRLHKMIKIQTKILFFRFKVTSLCSLRVKNSNIVYDLIILATGNKTCILVNSIRHHIVLITVLNSRFWLIYATRNVYFKVLYIYIGNLYNHIKSINKFFWWNIMCGSREGGDPPTQFKFL